MKTECNIFKELSNQYLEFMRKKFNHYSYYREFISSYQLTVLVTVHIHVSNGDTLIDNVSNCLFFYLIFNCCIHMYIQLNNCADVTGVL